MNYPFKRPAILAGLLAIFTVAAPIATLSQTTVLTGTIVDQLTGEPLPFAPVLLKKNLTGIAANEHGEFDLHLPDASDSDSLLVNVFGYKRAVLPIRGLSSPLVIRLLQYAIEIEEVTVTPQPPEYYVRQAMRRLKRNYPSSPFETVAFYREMVKENGEFVQCDEAVFRSYCPDYLDTLRNQDQVLLYRQADEIRPVEFMSEDRKTRKARRKGREIPPADTTKKRGVHLAASSFGGPQSILRSSKPGKGWNFLDTTDLRSFKYSFGANTTYNEREVMIIEFDSRGKVDHVRERGKLFIDRQDYAIIRIENAGEVVIPILIRPVLFTLGIGVSNPTFSRTMEFRQAQGRWFPQKILYDIEIKAVKRHMFSPNEHSTFHIDQVFIVSDLEVEKPTSIQKEKRFDSSKPIQEQVHNDRSLSWESVNVVKR